MNYDLNDIWEKVSLNCRESDHFNLEELPLLNSYIKSYIYEMANKESILMNQINMIYKKEVKKINFIMKKGDYFFNDNYLNRSVSFFIKDDNGFSIYEKQRFFYGLYKHMLSDLHVLFEHIERVTKEYYGDIKWNSKV